MNELKTLKDWEDKFRDLEKFMNENVVKKLFKKHDVELKLTPVDDVNIPIKELRQEAIKWIKHLESNKHAEEPNIKGLGRLWLTNEELDCQISIMNHFFNITEEDLK